MKKQVTFDLEEFRAGALAGMWGGGFGGKLNSIEVKGSPSSVQALFAKKVDDFMDELPLWSRSPKPTLTFRGGEAVLVGEIDDERMMDELEGRDVSDKQMDRTMNSIIEKEIKDGARRSKLKVKKIAFGGSFSPGEEKTWTHPGSDASFEDMGIKVTFAAR